MGLEFTTAKRRREAVIFTLDDREFSFNPPKSAAMLMPVIDAEGTDDRVMLKASFDWLGSGLSEEDTAFILSRLRDPEDDLDIDMVGELIRGLSEEIAGRPTT